MHPVLLNTQTKSPQVLFHDLHNERSCVLTVSDAKRELGLQSLVDVHLKRMEEAQCEFIVISKVIFFVVISLECHQNLSLYCEKVASEDLIIYNTDHFLKLGLFQGIRVVHFAANGMRLLDASTHWWIQGPIFGSPVNQQAISSPVMVATNRPLPFSNYPNSFRLLPINLRKYMEKVPGNQPFSALLQYLLFLGVCSVQERTNSKTSILISEEIVWVMLIISKRSMTNCR